MRVTVFTPTYNRKEKLHRLYEKLMNQTSDDFEWLIVDDGSNDGTEDIVNQFIKCTDKFSIRYLKKKNGGKYTAYNLGVIQAKGDLFVCVDSDDFLEETAIEELIVLYKKIKDKRYNGIIALKRDARGKILSDKLPSGIEKCKLIELGQKYNCKGEFTLIYKTNIARKYLFPAINNEKFMSECVVYDQIDQQGDMYLFNQVLTVCEYCEDGYTQNFMRVVLNNPTGYQIYYRQRIDMAASFRERFGYIVRYHAFKRMANNDEYIYKGANKFLVASFSPVGYLAYRLYMRKKKKL